MTTKRTDPRRHALDILNELCSSQITLDSLIASREEKWNLSRRDRALFNVLVFGVLRWQARLDWIIGRFSSVALKKIDPGVKNILRIGLFQAIYLDRIPNSAAVNTSVEMAKTEFAPHIVRFVNGLLRNTLRKIEKNGIDAAVSFPEIKADPVKGIAVETSFPEWMVKRWVENYGIDQTIEICKAANEIPKIVIRANSLKTDREQLIRDLSSDAESIVPTRFAKDGVELTGIEKSIPEMEAFKKGWFQVQDEAAQITGAIFNPEPGERILDACAGLGGKTAHMAMMMKNKGQIIAVDIDRYKLESLKKEMKRLGIDIVKTRKWDLTHPLENKNFGLFDKIFLDAPCSGMGVIRRNPDIKWSSSKKDLLRYHKRQVNLLSCLAPLLKPAGILQYTICSTEPEESLDTVNVFLSRNPDFVIEKNIGDHSPEWRDFFVDKVFFKTFPHINKTDGFFSVILKRNSKRNIRQEEEKA